LGYSPTPREDAAIFFSDHSFHFNLMTRKKQKSYRLPMEDVSVAQSGPNSYNALAASSIGSLLEIRKESIRQSLMEFQNSPHRMEEVTTLNGRTFINDSKATNLNATWFALEGMNKPVVWIVGGVDKGNDYGTVLDLVKSKVKTIVMLGKNVDKIRNAFDGQVDRLYHATSMEEAVHKAYQFGAEAGEESVVLLSPACASFDMYEDYEARGDHFKRVIRTLK
jgi:UDP-N-acetylmuramoylalanine--D-glutamate ligase